MENGASGQSFLLFYIGDVPTLRAGVIPAAIALENHPMDGRIKIDESGSVQTLTSRMGTGGMNVPLLLKIRSGCEGGGKGPLVQENVSATLSCNNDQTLFVPMQAYDICIKDDPVCNQDGIAVVEGPTYAMTPCTYTQIEKEKAPTLNARDFKGPTFINSGYSVRRLTPTECARLQGFPDFWCADLNTPEPSETDIAFWSEVWETHRRVVGSSAKPKSRNQIVKWLQHPHSDAAEYKMWGNGVALPNVFFVLAGIVWSTQLSGQ